MREIIEQKGKPCCITRGSPQQGFLGLISHHPCEKNQNRIPRSTHTPYVATIQASSKKHTWDEPSKLDMPKFGGMTDTVITTPLGSWRYALRQATYYTMCLFAPSRKTLFACEQPDSYYVQLLREIQENDMALYRGWAADGVTGVIQWHTFRAAIEHLSQEAVGKNEVISGGSRPMIEMTKPISAGWWGALPFVSDRDTMEKSHVVVVGDSGPGGRPLFETPGVGGVHPQADV